MFRKQGSIFQYQEVFTHKESYGFDEALGIQRIAERNSVNIYTDDNVVADIDAFVKPLYIRRIARKKWEDEAGIFRDIRNYRYQIFRWKDGKIFRYFAENGEMKTDEFMYLHLLKRRMEMNSVQKEADGFWVTPDALIGDGDVGGITVDKLMRMSAADETDGRIRESGVHKVFRKFKRVAAIPRGGTKIVIKKRLYFLFEWIRKLSKAENV